MGLKLRGVVRCGRCGKARGRTHLCNPGSRRRRRTTLQNPVTWECSTCHKTRGLAHTCAPRSDFKARKRKAATAERRRKKKAATARRAARRKQAAAERRAREKARKKTAPKSRPRPRGDGHEPGACGDRDCPRYGCKAYFQGVEDCPLPHDGGG
jgi:hypothetical protein